MSAPPKLSYADAARLGAPAEPVAPHSTPVVARTPVPIVTPTPAPAMSHAAPVPTEPVRRARAHSVGGSLYEGINSGDVTRTDSATSAVTTIRGRAMHWAVGEGNKSGAPAAVALYKQNYEFDNRKETGSHDVKHAPMGCVEARIESAIAAYHIDLGGRTTEKNVKAAWTNSASSTLSAVTDERGIHVPACGWCVDRGHK